MSDRYAKDTFWQKYAADAKALECTPREYKAGAARLNSLGPMRLLHATLGIASEAGELVDAVKKYVFYGAELDEVNLVEEIGDLQWYIATMLDELEVTMNEVLEKNIRKLLKKERRILEGDE